MEFDLASFMLEVTAALQPLDIPTSPNRPTNWQGHESRDPPQEGLNSTLYHESSVSRTKRRRLSPSQGGSDLEEDIRNQSHVWDEGISVDVVEGVDHSIPANFYPSLDMTTALVSCHPRIPPSTSAGILKLQIDTSFGFMPMEPLDLVPNFYAYSVKSCMLPILRVKHAVITHYFEHVHPMFPVVDEHHFTDIYRKFNDQEELMDKGDFIVFYAIMVAGFAHLSESELQKTSYRSVTEGQEALVDQLKARYWSHQTNDHFVLTQVSLILSLWSPGWVGFQNNSYWIDMAFKHATLAKLSDSDACNSSVPRGKVLWWCCVVRDRVLALGMRRPHRLHKILDEDTILTEEDFGLESKFPQYSELNMKRVNMLAFIWLCKLSRVMKELAAIQRRTKFARDWGGDGDRQRNIAPEIEELRCLHKELKLWCEEFEHAFSELSTEEINAAPISVSTLRIVASSLLATLYQPYLSLSDDHSALAEAGVNPLEIIKEGARGVARSVRAVMADRKSDAIPTWLVSWITLPVAVYHVNQRIRADSTPDKVLMPFLAQLVRRTSGALMLLQTVRRATKDHLVEISESPAFFSTNEQAQTRFTFVHSGLTQATIPKGQEAKLLASVSKAIDSALELNGSSQQLVLNQT